VAFLRCSGDSFVAKVPNIILKCKKTPPPRTPLIFLEVCCRFSTQAVCGGEHLLVGEEISGSALRKCSFSQIMGRQI